MAPAPRPNLNISIDELIDSFDHIPDMMTKLNANVSSPKRYSSASHQKNPTNPTPAHSTKILPNFLHTTYIHTHDSPGPKSQLQNGHGYCWSLTDCGRSHGGKDAPTGRACFGASFGCARAKGY